MGELNWLHRIANHPKAVERITDLLDSAVANASGTGLIATVDDVVELFALLWIGKDTATDGLNEFLHDYENNDTGRAIPAYATLGTMYAAGPDHVRLEPFNGDNEPTDMLIRIEKEA